MVFMNTKYNCPLQIWFTYDYPHQPPTCVVVPIPSMQIHAGHLHVGPDGLVYHPYLSEWKESFSLDVLCNELSQVFGKMPPVYSVAAGAVAQPPRPVAVITAAPTTTTRHGHNLADKDEDADLIKAIEASQIEEERRRREFEEKEDAAMARIIAESKAADDERRRVEQRKREEEESLRRAIQESHAMQERKRQELIALVSSKLQVMSIDLVFLHRSVL